MLKRHAIAVAALLAMLAFAPAAGATQFYQAGSGGFATVGAAINAAYAASPSFPGQDAVVCLPALATQFFNEAVNISGSLVGGGDNLGAGATGAFDDSPMLVLSGPSGYPQCGGSGGVGAISLTLGGGNCPNNVVTVSGGARVGLIAIGLYSNCASSAGVTQSVLSVKHHGYVRILGTSDPNLAVYLNGAGNPATADLLRVEGLGVVDVAAGKQIGFQGGASSAVAVKTSGLVELQPGASIACNISNISSFFRTPSPTKFGTGPITGIIGTVSLSTNNSTTGNCSTGSAAGTCSDSAVYFGDNSLNYTKFGSIGVTPGGYCQAF